MVTSLGWYAMGLGLKCQVWPETEVLIALWSCLVAVSQGYFMVGCMEEGGIEDKGGLRQ